MSSKKSKSSKSKSSRCIPTRNHTSGEFFYNKAWPEQFLQTGMIFDRKAENQPHIEWLQRDFAEREVSGADDEDGQGEEQDDGDENEDVNGLIEQCRETEQAQDQRVSTYTYQTIHDQTGNPFTSYYAAPPSLSTESCYTKDYVPSSHSAGIKTARSYQASYRDPAEKLDERFRVHRSNEFRFGRVFKVLWTEPSKTIRNDYAAKDSTAYHKVRRFVVVGGHNGHSIFLPILTYGSQGIPKNGVYPEDHAVIYTSRHAEYGDKGSTNRKHIHCPKCCQNCSARGEANADSAVDPCPDCSYAKCVSCEDRLTEQSAMALRHLHYNKARIFEHNLKVCFTGSMDQANVDQLLRGNPAWVQSDGGENIPVIMKEQTCSCLTCRRRHFLVAEDDKVPKKTAALLAISSGVLMSSSFIWLNTRMALYEPSVIMKKLIIAATRYDVSDRLQHMIPNEMIFVFFLLGTAGLTGTTIALFQTRRQFGPVFIMTLAGTVASWVLGFSVEEIMLVCLPLIIGCVILCSCTFGWKRTIIVDQDEKELLKSEV